MAKLAHNVCFSVLFVMTAFAVADAVDRSFNQYYEQFWGGDHFKLLQDGDDEVQLVLNQSSGGAGFKSKLEYLSGRFHVKMKLPKQRSKGVVPNFYLISENTQDPHNELDFEFIGTTSELRTNVFANDRGERERGFQLWFDPSDDFHSYTILWNSHQIVFFVDDVPITAYKNLTSIGARYPTGPMHIEATVWTADWAGQVDWSLEPFTIYYRDFTITGCPASSGAADCDSSQFEWNAQSQWELSPSLKQKLQSIEQTNMKYSYCQRSTSSNYPECSHS